MVLKKNIVFQFEKVERKEITITNLAKLLNCSRTWLSILYNRYKKGKPLELPKGHRKSLLTQKQKEELKILYKELSYEQKGIIYSPSMQILKNIAVEKIEDFPDINTKTMRKILNKDKVYIKHIKVKKYRKRFEAGSVGELIQGDVSTHNWIPDIDKKFHLILFIDDKSRYVLYAKFVESDNLENHIIALKDMIKRFGFPVSIYYDNDSKYNYIKHNGLFFDLEKDQTNGVIPNALSELGIRLINSTPYQPQGKGKVERKFLTFQNQIPFYLKIRNAKDIDDANKVLEEYIIKHNSTYSKPINDTPENVFRKSIKMFRELRRQDLEDLENAFTRRYERKVSNTNEIKFGNKYFVVPKYKNSTLASFKVEVRENPDKWIKIYYKGEFLIKYNLSKDKIYA